LSSPIPVIFPFIFMAVSFLKTTNAGHVTARQETAFHGITQVPSEWCVLQTCFPLGSIGRTK
ncbi:MAG: hypothetical protein KJ749_07105, partial [Planctomycetes bacterium]|nr:hypothetical protein [Planctomycetota bacterium]